MDTKALRQKVLDLAIRGKLVPQDPNDEPASVLLERIRQQKLQMMKNGKLKAKDIKNDTVIFVGEDNLHYEKFADGSVKCIEDEIPFEIPEGWAWARLKDLFNVCSSKRVLQSDWKTDGIPFYRAREIAKLADSGSVDNELFISEEHFLSLSQDYGVPQPGDLMVSAVGTIGKVYIVRPSDRFYYKDASVLCFENRNGVVVSEFARILLESSFIQTQMKDNSKGTTVDTITISTATNYLCIIPPMDEQTRILHAVQNALIYVDEVHRSEESLQTILSTVKSKILDLAIRGQLVPQDPNDEPASVLLDRIRAEKEELIKQGKIKRDKKESVIFKGEDNSYYQRVETEGSVLIRRVDIPPTWAACCLQEISYLIFTVGMQIKSEEIQEVGLFPVISQGQTYIDGYCSNKAKVIYDSPIILFGDHTRNVKYINFPFVVGADGTKLHKIIGINEKYAYYWMCYAAQHIADRGYARHYGFLQKACFTLPPLAEQARIVDCIEQLFAHLKNITDSLS